MTPMNNLERLELMFPDSDRGTLAMPAPPGFRENTATPEGRELGEQMARLCDGEAKRQGRDGRCATCAFRAGDHLSNGSPETLMTAVKCMMERIPFDCHEHDRPCAGWLLMRFEADRTVQAPWEAPDGIDPPSPNLCGVIR